ATNVNLEIVARVEQACRHRHLRRKMECGLGVRCSTDQLVLVTDISGDVGNAATVPILEPGEVVLDARPRQRIVDDDLMPLARQAIGEVRADESRAAGDQDRAGVTGHATSPLASSSARACSARSSAVWLATHSASSLSPSSKSFSARKPTRSAALAP